MRKWGSGKVSAELSRQELQTGSLACESMVYSTKHTVDCKIYVSHITTGTLSHADFSTALKCLASGKNRKWAGSWDYCYRILLVEINSRSQAPPSLTWRKVGRGLERGAQHHDCEMMPLSIPNLLYAGGALFLLVFLVWLTFTVYLYLLHRRYAHLPSPKMPRWNFSGNKIKMLRRLSDCCTIVLTWPCSS